jgi:hypothetical protein
LQTRGTYEACEKISQLAADYPELPFLRWTYVHARENALRETWTPPDPETIIGFAHNHRTRLVESGDHLLDVVLESLRRFEQWLQGTPPAAFLLWNHLPREKQRPKTENEISDAIALFLRADLGGRGVVFNREVQIRPRHGHGSAGERTDIQIDAVRKSKGDAHDTVTVILEAKGGWNREVSTAMQDQLCDRYLKDNSCQHGIYLVVWAMCPQWDEKDGRRRHHARWGSINDLRNAIEAQAAGLSGMTRTIRSAVVNAALR